MAIVAVNVNSTKEHVSKFDKDQANPTKWHLGYLDSLIMAEIDDQITVFEANTKDIGGSAKTTLKLNQSKIELVRFGLKNVENFIDQETDKPVAFDRIAVVRGGKSCNVVSDTFLKKIPKNIIYELADEIKRLNEFAEEEIKN